VRSVVMEQKSIEILHKTAEDFGAIARKVNESSKMRKNHSEEAIKYINLSMELGSELAKDIDSVAQSNNDLRNQDTIVNNTCIVLKSNLKHQKQLVETLKEKKAITPEIADAHLKRIKDFEGPLAQALEHIENIIASDNELVLLDNVLILKKKKQKDQLNKLKKLTDMALDDAEKAIQGSSSNLERGLTFVEKFRHVAQLVADKNRKELETMMQNANRGWNIAVEVNNSSKSQLEFAETVNNFTEQLHQESIAIQDLVIKKHHVFEQNLQIITVLTVLISLKFMKFLSVEEIIGTLEELDSKAMEVEDLITYITIACTDIRNIAALNYDMTDTSHLNNEIEDKSVKSTKKEIEYFDSIKREVASMTEATRFPIEGSGKNIENGKKLESTLKELIASM